MLASIAFLSACLAKEKPVFPSDPDQFQFVTTDIDRFWKVFDESKPEELEENLDKNYIKGGSYGLAFFNLVKINGPKRLAANINKRRNDYLAIREQSLRVKVALPRIKAAFYAMKYLYPEATFPPIYCVIGRHTSGGTANERGLMLGVEMKINNPNEMSYIVAHELIHFFQKDMKKGGLLGSTIQEGGADFVGTLASGGNINEPIWVYGLAHEKELWTEWMAEVAGKNRVLDWIATYGQKDPRPGDLGYFLGARICQAYYNKAADKKKAIKEIIECTDGEKFVKDSGYDPQ
jgi:hypothetical protein